MKIVEQDGQGAILTEPLEYAFWEHPLLPAGQERTGRFRITNETMRAVSVTMTPDLPYDDTVAMTYFAGLTVTIWRAEDGTVVYTGPYTGLADTVPLLSINPLRPGDSVEYGITLRCPFTYTGDPQEESSAVSWELSANAQIVTEQGGDYPAGRAALPPAGGVETKGAKAVNQSRPAGLIAGGAAFPLPGHPPVSRVTGASQDNRRLPREPPAVLAERRPS